MISRKVAALIALVALMTGFLLSLMLAPYIVVGAGNGVAYKVNRWSGRAYSLYFDTERPVLTEKEKQGGTIKRLLEQRGK